MGKRYGRQLLALLLVCAMILPNRLADAIGTGAMQAEAATSLFKQIAEPNNTIRDEGRDIYFYHHPLEGNAGGSGVYYYKSGYNYYDNNGDYICDTNIQIGNKVTREANAGSLLNGNSVVVLKYGFETYDYERISVKQEGDNIVFTVNEIVDEQNPEKEIADDIKYGLFTVQYTYRTVNGQDTFGEINIYILKVVPNLTDAPDDVFSFEYTGREQGPKRGGQDAVIHDHSFFLNKDYSYESGSVFSAIDRGDYQIIARLMHPEYCIWSRYQGYGDRSEQESKELVPDYLISWNIIISGATMESAPDPRLFRLTDPGKPKNDGRIELISEESMRQNDPDLYEELKGQYRILDSWGLRIRSTNGELSDTEFSKATGIQNLRNGTYKVRFADENHTNESPETALVLQAYNPAFRVELEVEDGGAVEFGKTLIAVLKGDDADDINDGDINYTWEICNYQDGSYVVDNAFAPQSGNIKTYIIDNVAIIDKYVRVSISDNTGNLTITGDASWAVRGPVGKKSAGYLDVDQISTTEIKYHVNNTKDEDGKISLPKDGRYFQYSIGDDFRPSQDVYSVWDTQTEVSKYDMPVRASDYRPSEQVVYYIRRCGDPSVTPAVEKPGNSVKITVDALYEVILDANGGEFANKANERSVWLKKGQKVIESDEYEEPAQDDKDFSGWFTDAGCTTAYDIDVQHVEAPLTLYAGWTLKPRPALQGKILIERKVALAPGEVTRICYATDAIAEFIEAEHPREPFDATKEKLQYSWCSVESAVYDAGGIDWDTYDGGTNGWTDWNDDSTYTPGKDDVGNRVVCRVRALENPGENPRREHYLIGSALVYKREIQITLTAVAPPIEKVYDGTDIGPASLVKASISDEELAKLPTADKKWGITVAIDPARSEDAVHFLTDEFVGNKKLAVYAEDLLLDWAHPGQDLDDKGRGPAAFYEPVMANELDAKIVAARQKLTIKPGSELDYTVSRSQRMTEANILASVMEKLDLSLCYGKLQLTMDERTDAASGTTSSGWKWEMDATGSYEYTAASSAGKSAVFRVGIKSANVGGDDEPEYEELLPADGISFKITTNNWGTQVIEFLDNDHLGLRTGAVTVKFRDVTPDADGKRIMDFRAYWTADTTGFDDPDDEDFKYLIRNYKIKYSSDNEAVATVDPNSGMVTLTGIGVATITASVAEWPNHYNACWTSCELTVRSTGVAKNDFPEPRDYVYDGSVKNVGTDPVLQPGLNVYYTLESGKIRGKTYTVEAEHAGTYTALAVLIDGFVWPIGSTICGVEITEGNEAQSIEVPWSIAKAANPYDKDVLKNIEGVNPTTDANDDGKIAGPKDPVHGGNYGLTTTIPHADKLEYRKSTATDADWKPCGNFVTDLEPGTYYVRYGERPDSDYLSGDYVEVVIVPTRKIVFRTDRGYIMDCDRPRRKELVIYLSEGSVLAQYFVEKHRSDGTTPANTEEDKMPLLESPTGYHVIGWVDQATNLVWSFENDRIGKENVVLVADWEAIRYRVEYVFYPYEFDNVAHGTKLDPKLISPMPLNPTTYTVEDEPFTLETPSCDGYEFEGWTSQNATLRKWSPTSGLGLTEERMWKGLTWSVTIDPATDLVEMIENNANQSGDILLEANFLERAKTPWVTSPLPYGEDYPYSEEQLVELAGPAGSIVYYTIGTIGTDKEIPDDPTENEFPYTGGIPVEETSTIKAIAMVDHKAPSEIMTAKFYIIIAPENDVRGVVVNPTVLTMDLSNSGVNIQACFTPDTAKDSEINYRLNWKIANEKIAVVEADPKADAHNLSVRIRPLKAGTTTLTATEQITGEKAEVKVIVSPAFQSAWVPVKGVTLSATDLSMRAGSEAMLGYNVKPANATDVVAEWSVTSQTRTENPKKDVVTVTQDGTIRAVSGGTATVELKLYTRGRQSSNGIMARASCKITVEGKLGVQSILIEPKALQLMAPLEGETEGESAQLVAAIYPEDVPNRRVFWSVTPGPDNRYADNEYINIDNKTGIVTAIKPITERKTVTIVALAADGAKDADGHIVQASIPCTLIPAVEDDGDRDEYAQKDPDGNITYLNKGVLWMAAVDDCVYTGQKITPLPHVYYDKRLLAQGTDYTVTYQNNLNAGTATVVVKLKGSYQGTLKKDFVIHTADINTAQLNNVSGFVKDGKRQELKPLITYGGKTLKENKDYRLDYNAAGAGGKIPYMDDGTWPITVIGIGNFGSDAGGDGKTATVQEILADRKLAVNLASVTVKLDEKNPIIYTGKEQKPSFRLMYNGGTMTLNSSKYRVTYSNNIDAGTATAVFTPVDTSCYGQKKTTFRIQKRDLAALVGSENRAGGTAAVTVDGQPAGEAQVVYCKGVLKPEVGVDVTITAAAAGEDAAAAQVYTDTLVRGKDFSVTWKNQVKTLPLSGTATIKGKGNYKGTVPAGYTILQQDLTNLQLVIDDYVYSPKPDAYRKAKITLRDLNGKVLKQGTDYYLTRWSHVDGVTPLPGTTITVTIQGDGAYRGTIKGSYRVISKDMKLSAAKHYFYSNGDLISPNQFYVTYEGKPVILSKSDLELLMKGAHIPSAQYEIIGFLNNDCAGKGTVILKGRGKYGGLKNIQFRILKQSSQ